MSSQVIKAVGIAGSTGAPEVILKIFSELKDCKLDLPIFITQHMVGSFLGEFSNNLAQASGRDVFLAKDKMPINPNVIYIAPGGRHLGILNNNGVLEVLLINSDPENFCKPSADPMFRELSKFFGRHLLGVVLTGIGCDGMQGARTIVENGGQVIAQDEKSCCVYGMPKAVVEANLASKVLDVESIAQFLRRSLCK